MPENKGEFESWKKAGSLQDGSRRCQAKHDCLEGVVLNAEVGRRVQYLPLTWTSLWNPYILGYFGRGKKELFSLVLSSLPGGKWDTEFPSEHENWPGFNYVSWQALADIRTKETSQPRLVFVVACSIYAFWTWHVPRALGGLPQNPPVALVELHGGYGASWNYLVTKEQGRSKA